MPIVLGAVRHHSIPGPLTARLGVSSPLPFIRQIDIFRPEGESLALGANLIRTGSMSLAPMHHGIGQDLYGRVVCAQNGQRAGVIIHLICGLVR